VIIRLVSPAPAVDHRDCVMLTIFDLIVMVLIWHEYGRGAAVIPSNL
jgi:hypothetical protein